MKKIIVSLSVIVAVAAVIFGVTTAFFSDTETSTGNTFTAGTLDLNVVTSGTGPAGKVTVNENGDGFNDNVVFTNLVPGDSGSIVWTITNTGSLDGFIDVHQALSNDSDGVDTEPELAVDLTPGAAGELDNEMVLTSSLTIDGLNVGFLPQPWVGKWSDIAVYGPAVDLLPVSLPAGKSLVMTYAWNIPTTVGNVIQGDTFTADFQMFLNQVYTP